MDRPDPEALWRDPANWNGGFYSCPADPRLVVPKRARWRGWTINFAHGGRSWATLLGLAALPTVPVLVSTGLALRTLPAHGQLPAAALLRTFAPPLLVMLLAVSAVCVICARMSRT